MISSVGDALLLEVSGVYALGAEGRSQAKALLLSLLYGGSERSWRRRMGIPAYVGAWRGVHAFAQECERAMQALVVGFAAPLGLTFNLQDRSNVFKTGSLFLHMFEDNVIHLSDLAVSGRGRSLGSIHGDAGAIWPRDDAACEADGLVPDIHALLPYWGLTAVQVRIAHFSPAPGNVTDHAGGAVPTAGECIQMPCAEEAGSPSGLRPLHHPICANRTPQQCRQVNPR